MSDYINLLSEEKKSNIRAEIAATYDDASYEKVICDIFDADATASNLRYQLAILLFKIDLMVTKRDKALDRLDHSIIEKYTPGTNSHETTTNRNSDNLGSDLPDRSSDSRDRQHALTSA